MRPSSLTLLILIVHAAAPFAALSQDTPGTARRGEPGVLDLRADGLKALDQGDRNGAIGIADQLIRDFPDDPRAIRAAADLNLRSGRIHTSVRQFERSLEQAPEARAELWQYGIALALAGKFDEGKRLFELHRTVNPRDVENAAWHFYCVAKAASAREARKSVLPAVGDSRVPMNEIRRMLIDGNEARVSEAIAKLPEGSSERRNAEFFAELYLALHADAVGDREKALRHAAASASIADSNYMGDVARVYLGELKAMAK